MGFNHHNSDGGCRGAGEGRFGGGGGEGDSEADRLFDALATMDGGGDFFSSSSIFINATQQSTNFYHNYRQIKINLIFKNNLMLFFSISPSAAHR